MSFRTLLRSLLLFCGTVLCLTVWGCMVNLALKQHATPVWTPQDMVDATVLVAHGTGWGSGVIIGPNEILTARHVVDDGETYTIFHGPDAYAVIGTYLDPDSDLALLHVAGLDFEEPASLLQRELVLGEPVWLTGTPADTEGLRDHLATGIVSRVHSTAVRHPEWKVLVNLDVHFGRGGSGGPVWVGGRVAAVYVGGWYEGRNKLSGVAFAVPVSELD